MTRAKEQEKENMKEDISWKHSQQGNESHGELNRFYPERIGLLEKTNKVRSTTNTMREIKEGRDL